TDSMQRAIDETNRRREKQVAYNTAHGITPQTIAKQISEMAWQKGKVAEGETAVSEPAPLYNAVELLAQVEQLEADMKSAALLLQFERAAALRDQLIELRGQLEPV
ncbi:MAG: UvrB/UvrC motif-containing protein, partial [Anaerolineales bacterium]|nr:UvrB/UvrC motif-containing protein [Anaerolineales bacterium]